MASLLKKRVRGGILLFLAQHLRACQGPRSTIPTSPCLLTETLSLLEDIFIAWFWSEKAIRALERTAASASEFVRASSKEGLSC